MTKVLFFILSLFVLVSCGAGHIPTWKQNAMADTSNFIESSFIGNESYAAKYFDKMLEDFRMTVDPDEIAKAYLTKCITEFALLEYSDCREAAEMFPLLKNKENIAYYTFVSGKARSAEEVPEKYREIFNISKNCDVVKANSALSSEKDPVTRLVKAAAVARTGCGNAETAGIAVNTASKEGWKKAALKYLALQLAYFEKHGDRQNAELIKKRMELVVSEESLDK
ncbi:hypothetical protein J5681_02130 [bacterium]|nr:hypothetical protein [bacterium]